MAKTYQDLRTRVVTLTQDFSLVGESGGDPDYAVDGDGKTGVLLSIIQSAVRNIVDLIPEVGPKHYADVELEENEYLIALPDNVRTVEQIRLIDSDGEIASPLEHKRLEDMDDFFGETYGMVEAGTPAFWARFPTTEQLVDWDYLGWVTGVAPDLVWPSGRGFVSDDENITVLAPNQVTLNGQCYLKLNEQNAKLDDMVVGYGPFTITGNCDTAWSFGTFSTGDSFSGLFPTSVPSGDFTLEVSDTDVAILGLSGTNFTLTDFTVSSVSPRGGDAATDYALVMPPSDEDRTARVYGKFHYPEFATTSDTNTLVTKHFELVVFEACRVWATLLGNSELVATFTQLRNGHLRHLEIDVWQEKTSYIANKRGGVSIREARRGY